MVHEEKVQSAEDLRQRVLATMRQADFYTDVPGVKYERPDVLEFVYGDCGGGQLLVRVVGEHVRATPFSGGWSGLPESDDDESAKELRLYGMLVDPRVLLACLTDFAIEAKGEKQALVGRIDLTKAFFQEEDIRPTRSSYQTFWWSELSDEEAIRVLSPRVRLVLDENDRVVSMTVNVVDPQMKDVVHTISEMRFFYR